jgi:hypothetical protein
MNCWQRRRERCGLGLRLSAFLFVSAASAGMLAADDAVIPSDLVEQWRGLMEGAPALEFEWTAERASPLAPAALKRELRYPGAAEVFPYRERVRYTILHPRVRAYRQIDKLTESVVAPHLSANRPSPEAKGASSPRGASTLSRDILEQEAAIGANVCYEGTWHLQGPDPRGEHKMLILTRLDEMRATDSLGRIIWPDFVVESGVFLPAAVREIGLAPCPLPLHWSNGFPDSPRLKSTEREASAIRFVFEHPTTGETENLLVDIENGYKIQEWTTSDADGRLLQRRNYSGSREVPGTKLVLPTSIRKEYFRWETNPEHVAKEPCVVFTYRLERVAKVSGSEDVFRLDYNDPGDFIADRTLPEGKQLPEGQVQYRIPADPGDLNSVIEAAKGGGAILGERPKSHRMWLIGANLALLIIVALEMYRRRAR